MKKDELFISFPLKFLEPELYGLHIKIENFKGYTNTSVGIDMLFN